MKLPNGWLCFERTLFDPALGTLNSATWVLRDASSGFTVQADGGAVNYLHAVTVYGYADTYGQAGAAGGLTGTSSPLTFTSPSMT